MGAKTSAWIVLAGCAGAAACIKAPAPLPPLPPTPPAYREEVLEPLPRPLIEIIDLQEQVSADMQRVTVTGTLINRGTAATSTLSVTVHAMDEYGHPVISISAVPSTNHIEADGGRAAFTATLDNRPEVRRYHVEAIAR